MGVVDQVVRGVVKGEGVREAPGEGEAKEGEGTAIDSDNELMPKLEKMGDSDDEAEASQSTTPQHNYPHPNDNQQKLNH